MQLFKRLSILQINKSLHWFGNYSLIFIDIDLIFSGGPFVAFSELIIELPIHLKYSSNMMIVLGAYLSRFSPFLWHYFI